MMAADNLGTSPAAPIHFFDLTSSCNASVVRLSCTLQGHPTSTPGRNLHRHRSLRRHVRLPSHPIPPRRDRHRRVHTLRRPRPRPRRSTRISLSRHVRSPVQDQPSLELRHLRSSSSSSSLAPSSLLVFLPGALATLLMASENPYTRAPPLAKASLGAQDPLFGFLPRKVTGKQVLKAMVRPLHRILGCCV